MTSVRAIAASAGQSPVIVCDVSPPRGGAAELLSELREIDADFLCVAYNPGQSVRVNPVICADHIQNELGKPAIFTLATRDMNRIAIQSLLLGASTLGLENVVALRGDPIRKRDAGVVREVNDYTTTALVEDIRELNRGRDFRGLALARRASFCVGVVTDPSRGLEAEVALATRKIRSGADFILCQALFDTALSENFAGRIHPSGESADSPPPLFQGVQVFDSGGVNFGNVPERIVREARDGGDGIEIAKRSARELLDIGVRRFYLTPSILRCGARDYEGANELIHYIRGAESADVPPPRRADTDRI